MNIYDRITKHFLIIIFFNNLQAILLGIGLQRKSVDRLEVCIFTQIYFIRFVFHGYNTF